MKITQLYFSQIIFNIDDIESSKKYVIVTKIWETPVDGGFLALPEEFMDNFIMAVTDFETLYGYCGFEYQWIFT